VLKAKLFSSSELETVRLFFLLAETIQAHRCSTIQGSPSA
jgi:hypothetical protein